MPSAVRVSAWLPLGQALGRLDAEAVDEELLGELALALEPADQLGHLIADGDPLQGDHVALAAVDRAVEVGEADAVVPRLAREDEALELAVVILGIEDTSSLPSALQGK